MWLCAMRGACCYHARAGLFVRPWTRACSSTRRQHSERSGVLASLRSWSPRLGRRAYAAGVLSFRFASDLLAVRTIAIPGAIGQIAFATALGMGLAWWIGWPLGAGLVFGLTLSVASTVVLLRALQERRIV
jgi:hypothetical protein